MTELIGGILIGILSCAVAALCCVARVSHETLAVAKKLIDAHTAQLRDHETQLFNADKDIATLAQRAGIQRYRKGPTQ